MAAFTVGKLKEYEWNALTELTLRFKNKPSTDRVFASSSSLCSRQTAGMLLMDPAHQVENSASSQFYFAIGNAFEEVIREVLVKGGIPHVREFSVREHFREDLPPISGRIDFLFEKEGEMGIIELKTCGDKLPVKPKPYHLAQLNTYLLLTGVDKGILWYMSRNVADWEGNLRMKVFEIIPSPEQMFETAETIAQGMVSASRKLLPPIPAHMKQYKCGFCPLAPLCWNKQPAPLQDSAVHANHSQWSEIVNEASLLAEEIVALREMKKAKVQEEFNYELGLVW